MGSAQEATVGSGFNEIPRYVRICKERPDGFIEFEFAIGDPELCVELMLPAAAFREFCLTNKAVLLDSLTGDAGDWVQRMNQATHQEYGDTN